MQAQQLGASLQIVQQQNYNLQITYNSINLIKNHSKKSQQQSNDDIFQYSIDENSLSFQIQQDNQIENQIQYTQTKFNKNVKNQKQIQQNHNLVVVQQQRKRKRKQIFEKYKKPSNQHIQIHLESSRKNYQLMNTFDQIFSIKSPSNVHKIIQKNSYQKTSANSNISYKIHNQQKTSNMIVTEPLKTNQNIEQNKHFIDEFQIPSKISDIVFNEECSIAINGTTSFILQQKQIISVIESLAYQQQQISQDLDDFQSILQSQIFKQQVFNHNHTIQVEDVTYKNFQISTVNPSIIIENEIQANKNDILVIESKFELVNNASKANLNPIQNKNNIFKKKNSDIKLIRIKRGQKKDQKLIVKNRAINYTENRIPQFLRQIRMRNTVVPNFFIKKKNQQFFMQQNIKMKQLWLQFRKALQFLYFINEATNDIILHQNEIKLNLMNSLTLKYFMMSEWQKAYEIRGIQRLRPCENFIKRPYDYMKVKQALSNYIKIVGFYQKLSLNLQQQIGQKKYFKIRNKFWQIQKNIKMISQDIYSQSLNRRFYNHYYEYLAIMKGELINLPIKQRVQYYQNKLSQYYQLKNQGDLLCLSQIGSKVRERIEKLICKCIMI